MTRLSLARKQTKILKKIRECGKPKRKKKVDGILKIIKDFDEETVRGSLADTGSRLLGFVEEVGLSHPDLVNLVDGQLTSSNPDSFNWVAVDTLRLISQVNELSMGGYTRAAVRQILMAHAYTSVVRQSIGSPLATQRHVRFVPDRERRDTIRASKEWQPIDRIYDISAHWSQYDNFDIFFRGVNRYQKDIDQAETRLAHFKNLNLPSMATEIEKSLRNIKSQVDCDSYYGFNKLDVNLASIILAKLHDFQVENDEIYATPDNFQYPHWKGVFTTLSYQPRLYPHWVWKDHTPKRITEIIDLLESYPEAGGHPLFDHYRILVPGVAYTGYSYKTYEETDEQKEFEDHWEVVCELDKDMVKYRDLVPILLGEREGEHYFICYWM